MWASELEREVRFLGETVERRPADPGDVRFENGVATDAMEETPYWLETIDDTGAVVGRDWFATQGAVWDFVEALRETQAFTLEERLGEFGLEWQREHGLRA